jgi:hypothetical protein
MYVWEVVERGNCLNGTQRKVQFKNSLAVLIQCFFFVMLELYPLFLDCPFELAAGQCYKEHAFHLY